MSVAGASIPGEHTICHQLQTTRDDELTESERQRARVLVKDTLVEILRKSTPQYQSLTPIENTEVRSPIDVVLLLCRGPGHVDKASILMSRHMVSTSTSMKAHNMTKSYLMAVVILASIAI